MVAGPSSYTIRVDQEVYRALLRLKGNLESKQGRPRSMNDALSHLVENCSEALPPT